MLLLTSRFVRYLGARLTPQEGSCEAVEVPVDALHAIRYKPPVDLFSLLRGKQSVLSVITL